MKTNFSALLAKAGLALAAALLISIGLASCSKNKNKTEQSFVHMISSRAIDTEIEIWFGKDDGPIIVEGAQEVSSTKDGERLKNKYKLKAQSLTIKGRITILDCSDCGIASLDVSKKQELKELYCYGNILNKLDISKNLQLTHLQCYANSLSKLDLSKNVKLIELHCYENSISGDALSMPDIKATGESGEIYFKNSGFGGGQKLSAAQVSKIKDLGWSVLYLPEGDWADYPGED